jgi:hypothetical protein
MRLPLEPRKERDEEYHKMVKELEKAVKDQMMTEDEAYQVFRKNVERTA